MAWANGPLSPGETFLSKYEVRDLIGRGGNACVYHAVNSFLGMHVAIKVLHRPGGLDRESLRRGQAEAQILNRLRHPNIVEVFDAGITDGGLLYIVMELLRGRPFRDVINENGALTVGEVCELALQVADGVHAAHQMGVIHRDLKPENLFVSTGSHFKILDFGIAKVADSAAWTTEKDAAPGTVLYMSPEQIEIKKLTPASDVYALGVVMYEALLGKHPIPMLIGETLPNNWQISRAILSRKLPMLDELDARIPSNLAVLVNRAVAKDPTQRFSTMAELAHEIRECLAAWRERARVEGILVAARDLSVPTAALPHTVPLVLPSTTPQASSTPPRSGHPPMESEPQKFGAISSFLPPELATERAPGPVADSASLVATPSTQSAVATGVVSSGVGPSTGGHRRRVAQVLVLVGLFGGAIGGSAVFLKSSGDHAASRVGEPALTAVAGPTSEPVPDPAALVPAPPSATTIVATASTPARTTPPTPGPTTGGVAVRKIPAPRGPVKPSATTRPAPKDKVEERLLKLEKSLEPDRP